MDTGDDENCRAGVVGGLVVIFSFLVLGAELLAPEGIMPEGPEVAVDLTSIFRTYGASSAGICC
ncbi:hypothetical protein HSBAA_61140 [Vreelandella sulfidaeris]|uniref:Uncharacterized protein n=1 Tax=Vreelandella sulfidaeris TaxID=115553 RepID=A0A455UKC7_9GAMM|nr:hypothetical protein HSBAA_61140 [Halomonas sulfidaeris]